MQILPKKKKKKKERDINAVTCLRFKLTGWQAFWFWWGLGYEQEGTMVPVRVRVVQYHAHLSYLWVFEFLIQQNDMLSFDKCKRDKKIKKSHWWLLLIGRISVGISHFSFTILDFCFLWVSCGGPRSHFQINLIKTLHLHFTSLWLYGFLLSLGIWHRKQIILRQENSWSLNSFFSQVDTQLYSPFTEANLMFFHISAWISTWEKLYFGSEPMSLL